MLKYTKQLKKAFPKCSLTSGQAVKRHISMQTKLVASTTNNYKYNSYSGSTKQNTWRMNAGHMAALSLLGLVGGYELLKKKLQVAAECCGIIGYVGQEPIAGKLILDGIQILQYRGYDS
jgi:hypothetical protein